MSRLVFGGEAVLHFYYVENELGNVRTDSAL